MLKDIGIFLLLWVIVGFLTGLKIVFIDKTFSSNSENGLHNTEFSDSLTDEESLLVTAFREVEQDIQKKVKTPEEAEEYYRLFKNKYVFIFCVTICGFLSLASDFLSTLLDFFNYSYSKVFKKDMKDILNGVIDELNDMDKMYKRNFKNPYFWISFIVLIGLILLVTKK